MVTVRDLGSYIARAEALASRLGRRMVEADILELLTCLDLIADACDELVGQGSDLRAEAVRIETVHRTLAEHGAMVVRSVGKRDRWAQLRADRLPRTAAWWWWLDRRVAQRRRAQGFRVATWVLAAIVVGGLLSYLYRYLGPDEKALQRAQHLAGAEECMQRDEYACALEQVQMALGLAPDDPEINLKAAVLMEALERTVEADAAYARAATLYQDRALFLAMRGQEYISLRWFAQAVLDAEAAMAADDQLALSYCTLGGAYEGQGNLQGAVDAFERCADLAFAHQQNELYVLASSRLAILLQAR